MQPIRLRQRKTTQALKAGAWLVPASVVGYLLFQFAPGYFEIPQDPSPPTEYVSDRTPFESAHVPFGLPSSDCTILERTGYVACHDGETKVSDWTSYRLTPRDLEGGVPRKDAFRPDSDLPAEECAQLSDYKGSGFDRGHLVPAGDMKRSEETMSESFFLSNMAPQAPQFNRGIWKSLEAKVRELGELKDIFVFTGPIYESPQGAIGENEVAVPSHFFKIVVTIPRELIRSWHDPQPAHNSNPGVRAVTPGPEMEAAAFILPNEPHPSSELKNFQTTVDEVEARCGLDFLHELDDVTETKLESIAPQLWWG